MSSVESVRKPAVRLRLGRLACISLKTTVPVAVHTMRMPSMKPKSPMRLAMKALLAAAAAASRVNQWPMSRYELTPTSSQKMNIITKLFERTTPSIENMKKESDAK
jgi:hypothetical protein